MTHVDSHVMDKIGLLGLGLYLGNITKACKMMGVSRQHYYDIKKIYEKGGAEALIEAYSNHLHQCGDKDEPASAPGGESPAPAARRPGRGASLGPRLSAPRPGSLLLRQTLHAGYFKGLGSVLQHSVIDAHSRYALATLSCGRAQSFPVRFMDETVFPFFEALCNPVERVVTCTDAGGFTDKQLRAEDAYFSGRGVEHHVIACQGRKTALPCVRFNAMCEKRYLHGRFRERFQSLTDMGEELGRLLDYYNAVRVQKGHPCKGRTPLAALKAALPVRVLAQCASALGLVPPHPSYPAARSA
jgi:hypothetical protein